MSRFSGLNQYQHEIKPGTGVLLVNLGTPESPSTTAVRRYLREFLSDRRVVEIPKPIWWLILNGIILPFRAKKSAKLYQKIWTEQGSPLRVYTESIADKLRQQHPECHIEAAMTYGQPSIENALTALRDKQIKQLIILPLFPQYSGTTTAAIFDAVSRTLQRWRWVPELSFIHSYHDQPQYISAIAAQIKESYQQHEQPDKILFSFHGIPEAFVKQGDPYYCYCMKSGRLIAEQLKLTDEQWQVTFQSQFGKAKWISPYTDATIESLASSTDSIAVVCPGFSVDCLETLEEIDILNREIYLSHGGKHFHYIPALNDSPGQIELLSSLISQRSNV